MEDIVSASKDVLMGIATLLLQLNNLLEVALDAGMARPMVIPRRKVFCILQVSR